MRVDVTLETAAGETAGNHGPFCFYSHQSAHAVINFDEQVLIIGSNRNGIVDAVVGGPELVFGQIVDLIVDERVKKNTIAFWGVGTLTGNDFKATSVMSSL